MAMIYGQGSTELSIVWGSLAHSIGRIGGPGRIPVSDAVNALRCEIFDKRYVFQDKWSTSSPDQEEPHWCTYLGGIFGLTTVFFLYLLPFQQVHLIDDEKHTVINQVVN